MIGQKLLSAGVAVARDGVRVLQGAASHVLWWVDHNVGGRPRNAPDDPRRRARREG